MAIPAARPPPKRSSRSPILYPPPTPPVSPLSQPPRLPKIVNNRPARPAVNNAPDEMEEVDIPSEKVPEGLKACEQILKRAKELKRAEPVVAYWCCFSAAEKVLKVHGRTKEQTMFLMSLLDALEKMKSVLANNDAVLNEAAGAAYIENFALKVFMSADNDDRNGNTGKATIRKFVVAGQFIEVLRCFENGMTEEKLQYARWKAADGAKALREGREPTSGPPVPEPETSFPTLPEDTPSTSNQPLSSPPSSDPGPSFPQTSSKDITPVISPRGSPTGTPRANLPQIDTSSTENLRAPGRTHSSGSGAWSTVATPGVADDGGEPHFELPATHPTPPMDDDRSLPTPPGAGKNVRFMGPDGAPLSPAQTHLTVDSYDAPDAPPPTTFDASPTEPKAPPPSRPPVDSFTGRPAGSPPLPPPNGANAGPSRTRGDSASRPSPTPRTGALPPPPPPSLVQYPSQPGGALGLTSPPPTAPPLSSLPPPSGSITLSRKQTETVQKHARWAISALEFDDVETARTELRKALAVMGG